MKLENRLAGETSPYLQQHRNNPVYWQPWNKETLALARALDRPILLSIGYAACHWCHVMAHECFEDAEVAERMNRHFVNIKVDREERPDIDQIYMTALAATGEQGGWPLTMFLTPSGEPIWGGTYFPKLPRYGRPGFLQVLDSVASAWEDRRGELETGANAIRQHIAQHLAPAANDGVALPPLERIADAYHALLDPVHGGLRGAPKFPNAPILRLLWLAALANRDRERAEAVIFALERMLLGGIYDHVGGGLCRYATDEAWLLPHFEKMLYDNAQLIELLAATAPYGPRGAFQHRIAETIAWLEREMRTDSGAYASSLDADSEGQEGKYYLWQRQEIETILGGDIALFDQHFELVSPSGWEHDPILVRKIPGENDAGLSRILDRLHKARSARVRPGRDDKILTDWNGIAIRAIADAGRLFQQEGWIAIAVRVFHAIEAAPDGRLPHSVNGSAALYPAFSSDYAAMISAAVALFQATLDGHYLEQARRWAQLLDEDHGDGLGSYYLTAAGAEDVPIRIRGDYDEALPSPTAQIIEALIRLAAATGDPEFHERVDLAARQALQRTGGRAGGQAAVFHAARLVAENAKLVTTGDRFRSTAAAYPDPRRLDLALPLGAPVENPLPQGVVLDHEREAAYLCPGLTCLPPFRDPEALAGAINPFPRSNST